MRRNFGWALSYALAAAVAVFSSAYGVERDFSVVPSQSNIAASGTVTLSGITANIQSQAAGSLTTAYSGTIKTNRESNSLSFVTGSSVAANVNGNWKPDGNQDITKLAAADYGGKVTIVIDTAYFAARQLSVGVSSGPITVDAGGHFDLSAAMLTFTSGNLDYGDTFNQLMGPSSLANKTASITGTGVLSSATQSGQTTETLTIPINSTFVLTPNDTTTVNLTLTGQLVATTTFAAGLPGDYNQNGVVDAADYVLWRDKLGSGTSLQNDDTAGVGSDDYSRWRARFGQTASGSGASLSDLSASVPETSTAALFLVAVIGFVGGGRVRLGRRKLADDACSAT